jgi:hypothetical protein
MRPGFKLDSRMGGDAIAESRFMPCAIAFVRAPGLGGFRFQPQTTYSRSGSTMSKNRYVGNISYQTTADDLREAFGQFGAVTAAQVVADRETGRSRGFGFVEMADGAEKAVAALNGAMLQGRPLTVNEARPRGERPRPGGYAERAMSGAGRRY